MQRITIRALYQKKKNSEQKKATFCVCERERDSDW